MERRPHKRFIDTKTGQIVTFVVAPVAAVALVVATNVDNSNNNRPVPDPKPTSSTRR